MLDGSMERTAAQFNNSFDTRVLSKSSPSSRASAENIPKWQLLPPLGLQIWLQRLKTEVDLGGLFRAQLQLGKVRLVRDRLFRAVLARDHVLEDAALLPQMELEAA
jgi:hypothetical protein